MPTYAVTGAASGIGAATAARLRAAGNRVIGVDLAEADVVADLATPEGRRTAVAGVADRCDEGLAGLVPCAGLAGLPERPASLLVSVNYFGAIEVVAALRDVLAAARGAVVVISSNSTTCQPGYSPDLVDALLAGDEAAARRLADEGDSLTAYPATKAALARWVRRHAPADDWVGAGVRLNAVFPGMVETPLVAEGRADPVVGPLLGMYPMPLGRAGRPEEIAAAVDFLLHTELCVGTLLLLDGGTETLLRPDDWPALWRP